ncbi:MAG: UDP-N-acetylglucosamine 1-carboxyvinyltransferase [Proteobacteria bacterium]|nr:UDP-N-acetylglucosamine 1-carboxyvinyltransferase [Pseudomonadota bacterium]
MDRIIIRGGNPLHGEVTVSGAKNAALPLLAATLLASGQHSIAGVPKLRDITTMRALLEHLGCETTFTDDFCINTKNIQSNEAPYRMVKTMRASFLVLGPLLARFHRARVSLPGGCAIGVRPVDIHLKALETMGVSIAIDMGYVNASCKKLKGARLSFDIPTVGGTENVMMAASLADGVTTIVNAAREPEIVELAQALKKMGARISGEGSDTITIEGVKELNPLVHTLMPDRIEAGTFMVAAGITGGDITIKNCPLQYMESVVEKLREAGLSIEECRDTARVRRNDSLIPVEVKTLPYPGFPTDMQAQIMALATRAPGSSVIRETIFENRFTHVAELERMGADIRVEQDSAIVTGVDRLRGAPVMATDLRASASLVLAGLAAEGTTTVSRVYHLDRGYENLEIKLRSMGADIYREKE